MRAPSRLEYTQCPVNRRGKVRSTCRFLLAEGPAHADVAQLVEHFTRNEGVPGSNPGVGLAPTCIQAQVRDRA